MSAARRCSTCSLDWPDRWHTYKQCPKCLGKTDAISDGDPMEPDEALSLKKHFDFDRFYEAREQGKVEAEKNEREALIASLDAAAEAAQSPPDGPPQQVESD